MVERNENSLQIAQDNQIYILKTSIIGDKIKMQCYNIYDQNQLYIGIINLTALRAYSPIFNNIQNIEQSSQYINSLIERKSIRISISQNDSLLITLFLHNKSKMTLFLSRGKNYQYSNQR